jgi:hypothetical protein
MKKILVATAIAAALVVPGTPLKAVEGCEAVNPGQPTCTYKAAGTTVFGGAAGQGKWVVTVKVGRKTTTYRSPSSGEPTGTQFLIKKGAKVTAKALAPGSGVIVGGQ